MVVLITGDSCGIGRSTVYKFLDNGHHVIGIDVLRSSVHHHNYTHFIADVSKPESLPDLPPVDILINNAGTQDNEKSLEINLGGVVNCTEKYGIHPGIKSIVNVASASAHTGAEFPLYSASKGAVLAYTKNVALRVAEFGATCNSLSPGGVVTDINKHILDDPKLWKAVLNETLLDKWASASEIADWIYFVAVTNKSMTAQDILIDNGEMAKSNFIW